MSKQIKQMQMDALKQTFAGVRDLVVLSATKLPATAENQLRLSLRKKKIRMQMVKNSLARRVLGELGINLENVWEGPTILAWGGESIKDLSKALEPVVKKDQKDKVTVKAAIADGQQVTYEQALTMPTRLEAIGEIVGAILGPGGAVAACLTAPAGQVAGQIQTIAEKTPEGEPAAAAG